MTLTWISSNKFMGFADGNILNWCPVLNLLFVSMNKMSIWVYRLNGERIYSINNKLVILQVSFSNNGLFFCVSGIDGLVKIYDSNNGNLIKVLSGFNNIKLISWNLHKLVKASRFEDLYKVDLLNELPRVIEFAENLTFLTIVDGDNITFNFNNLLTVDGLNYPQATIIHHLSNHDLFKQVFLGQIDSNYQLLSLQTNLSEIDKRYTITIIENLCKLIALINHIEQQIIKIDQEMAPFIKLLDRYIGLLALEYQDIPLSIIKKYFSNYILTGLIDPKSKDFWLNQFGERGYKSLIKLGNNCYDSLRKILYSQIITSLEKIMIIGNDLLGISTWIINSENEFDFGLSISSLKSLLDTSGNFIKQIYKFIWEINHEQKLFNNFFDMVKHEFIDKLIKEDDLESYLQIKKLFSYSDILKYINSNLFYSILFTYTKFDVDNYDIFEPRESDQDLTINTMFDNVDQSMKTIKISFNQFFPSTMNVNVCLELPNWDQISLELVNSYIMIIGWKDSKLQAMKIDNDFNILSQKSFDMEIPISFELRNNEITLLFADRIMQIKGDVLWEEIGDAISLTSLKYSEIMINLDQPTKIGLADNFGCVLDKNRQNYTVFKKSF